jgi:hypothetical protein
MFLTLEDPRAKIQGSRDPLGLVPLWSAFGRRVVANLTTVSTSVRGFTILMLARYLTQRLIEDGAARETDALGIFLRMEQIGAYARHVGHGVTSDIRGIERVKRAVAEANGKVLIHDNAIGMILSDQKTYGLWGLYTVPARVSGIAAAGAVGLTASAREFVKQHYWPTLKPVRADLSRLVTKGGYLNLRKTNPIMRAMIAVLPERLSRAEKRFYADTLRDAAFVANGAAKGRQALLATLLRNHTNLSTWLDREQLIRIARAARARDESLAASLNKMLRLEALIAPAEALFEYMQARDGRRPKGIAESVRGHWDRRVPNLAAPPFAEIASEVEQMAGRELVAPIRRCDEALGAGDYEAAVRALLKWNEIVMGRRKSAPWLRLESGELQVRYRGTERELPGADTLPSLWRNSYFLNALKNVTRQIGKDI